MNNPVNERKSGKKRIMVQIWGPVAKAIDRDFKALHIKRDGYLNDLFTREIEELAREVTFRNSDEVRTRLRQRPLPNRVKLNLDLDESLILRMDAVLKEKNIPRDSFVNRVLFFLVAKQVHLDALNIDYDNDSHATAKPLDDAMGNLFNPFFHIRNRNDGNFYTLVRFPDAPFGKSAANLFALNTAINEQDWQLMNIDLDDFLGDLGVLPNAKREANNAPN